MLDAEKQERLNDCSGELKQYGGSDDVQVNVDSVQLLQEN